MDVEWKMEVDIPMSDMMNVVINLCLVNGKVK